MLNLDLPFPSGRQPVLGRNIVATTQPLAAQAGAKAFARGGNAVDAALATAIALTVVEPVMNGIGGDSFAIVWDGNKLAGLNSSGRSPRGWSPQRFKHLGAMPERGWDSVTVPGQVAGWAALSEKFGKLPFEDLFEDAIRHARDGFPVSPVVSRQWTMGVNDLHSYPGFSAFMPRGRAPAAGEIWKFEDQASTLEEIARTRGASLYSGRLADAIVRFAREHNAALSHSDLASHEVRWVEPIRTTFRGHEVHEIPPNGQGLAALIALGVLERLPLDDFRAGSPERMHLEIEAMRVAFADLHAHVADPAFMTTSAEDLLSDAYLTERAKAIDPKRAGQYAPGKPRAGGTVYICAADESGCMVSYIQSNYRGFGSGVVVPGTGISLQNRASGFVTTPGHPNQVDGGKLPFHTIIPAFLTKDGKPSMAFGVMGANMQAQGHVQVVMRHVAEGFNPQASSDAPRWRIDESANLTLEATVPAATAVRLTEMGHRPEVLERDSLEFGSAQLVQLLESEDNKSAYIAGSDHRRDGHAIAY
jgi:gamma-glutamyltranspeptidase/glutathione hydrolase